jgi:CO dehydrogenase/acetyl-CoA synthase alpha subunit
MKLKNYTFLSTAGDVLVAQAETLDAARDRLCDRESQLIDVASVGFAATCVYRSSCPRTCPGYLRCDHGLSHAQAATDEALKGERLPGKAAA